MAFRRLLGCSTIGLVTPAEEETNVGGIALVEGESLTCSGSCLASWNSFSIGSTETVLASTAVVVNGCLGVSAVSGGRLENKWLREKDRVDSVAVVGVGVKDVEDVEVVGSVRDVRLGLRRRRSGLARVVCGLPVVDSGSDRDVDVSTTAGLCVAVLAAFEAVLCLV